MACHRSLRLSAQKVDGAARNCEQNSAQKHEMGDAHLALLSGIQFFPQAIELLLGLSELGRQSAFASWTIRLRTCAKVRAG